MVNRLHADESFLTQTLWVRLPQPQLSILANLALALGKTREEVAKHILIEALDEFAKRKTGDANHER